MLDGMCKRLGEENFCSQAAIFLVAQALPDAALPENLKKFSAMVSDGVAHFIARTPYQRLREILLQLLELPDNIERGEMLFHLARCFPTLQKLCQIVARNPQVDHNIRGWLVKLEKEEQTQDEGELSGYLNSWLEKSFPHLFIELSGDILARASVAVVKRFKRLDDQGNVIFDGVFKVLKPQIESVLQEELITLEEIFITFHNNRGKYGLANMEIERLFNTVRNDLAREIDLLAEQRHLAEAQEIYTAEKGIRIPQLEDFCNPRITAMEFIEGSKITDTSLPEKQRKELANLVFEAVICTPLFSEEELALFHGDPHAGNIMAVACQNYKPTEIALVDWTLAGHLSKKSRLNLIHLMIGIICNDQTKITQALYNLTESKNNKNIQIDIAERVKFHLEQTKYKEAEQFKKSFILLEKLSMDGVLFSAELILFRKAFFTLEGVLEDLAPEFDLEGVMEKYLGKIIMQELPDRLRASLLLQPDHSLDYRSMLSNRDLEELSFHQSIVTLMQAWKNTANLIEMQTRLTTDFIRYFTWFCR